jgi:hypothetical protein
VHGWSPTIDPEALKTLSLRMAEEARVQLLLHAWCTAPILENGIVQGVRPLQSFLTGTKTPSCLTAAARLFGRTCLGEVRLFTPLATT